MRWSPVSIFLRCAWKAFLTSKTVMTATAETVATGTAAAIVFRVTAANLVSRSSLWAGFLLL